MQNRLISQSICLGFSADLDAISLKLIFNCSAIMKNIAALTSLTQFYSLRLKSASFFINYFPSFIFHISFVEWDKEKSPLSSVLFIVFKIGTSQLHMRALSCLSELEHM